MAYVREEMEGLACTEDVLRVVPNTAKIPSGYLYAYLSSKFGIPLIASGTYGAIIQHLEPEHISGLPVPRFGAALEKKIHDLIEEAGSLRSDASSLFETPVSGLPFPAINLAGALIRIFIGPIMLRHYIRLQPG